MNVLFRIVPLWFYDNDNNSDNSNKILAARNYLTDQSHFEINFESRFNVCFTINLTVSEADTNL